MKYGKKLMEKYSIHELNEWTEKSYLTLEKGRDGRKYWHYMDEDYPLSEWAMDARTGQMLPREVIDELLF